MQYEWDMNRFPLCIVFMSSEWISMPVRLLVPPITSKCCESMGASPIVHQGVNFSNTCFERGRPSHWHDEHVFFCILVIVMSSSWIFLIQHTFDLLSISLWSMKVIIISYAHRHMLVSMYVLISSFIPFLTWSVSRFRMTQQGRQKVKVIMKFLLFFRVNL